MFQRESLKVLKVVYFPDTTPFYVYVGIASSATSRITKITDQGFDETILSLETGMWEMNYFYEDDAFWYTHGNNTYR